MQYLALTNQGRMSMETEPGPTDNLHLEAANAMMGLLNGSWAARLVHAAAELGIADHLVGEARDAAFLAAATQAHAPSLARLLRALTAIGVAERNRRSALQPHTAWHDAAKRCPGINASVGAFVFQ
jgi:hypothetical protein